MTPDGYPSARVAELWGGTVSDTSGVDFTAACQAAQSAAETGEQQRRELASQMPGLGAPLALPQPYAGAGQGSPLTVGEGYEVTADMAPAVHKAYGPGRPVYADGLVGGLGFQGGHAGQVVSVFTGQRTQSTDNLVVVASAGETGSPRPGRLSRLAARLRRR